MQNISRTGLMLVFIGTIVIAAVSAFTASSTTLLFGIWLITLALIGYAGFATEWNHPVEEVEPIAESSELEDVEIEKDKFFARTAEELRIPLTAIDGHVELLRDQHLGRITKEQKESLNAINQEIDHITRMTIDIAELANLEVGNIPLKKEEVSFTDIIDNTTHYMLQTLELKGIEMKKDLPHNLPAIPGDRDQLTRAFANILSNAIKYTSEGKIFITASAENGELLVSVADTGAGIPEAAIGRVFDSYYMVDPASHGTGLGLSTAKKIIEMHGGRIWAESSEGHGSTFRFTVPVS